ncbi:MAG: nucleotidyltransferase family protein, partial [Gemmatimonadota bacterium]|nr:nucleotidyltransferase family protein [Gemmatimonadota bacterium]
MSGRRSALATALTVMLPSREMTWLLRAALLDGSDARDSWREWRALTGDVKAAMADDSLPLKRMLPLLFASLRRAGADVDMSLVPYLRLAYAREQMRSATYLRILRDMLSALDREAVPAIALRGAALSVASYAEPALRHCHDIDLLIPPDDLERAASALERLGLARSDGEPDRDATGIRLRHSSGLPIELHSRLFDSAFYYLPAGDAWARALPQRVAGIAMTILSPADMLLHIGGHASGTCVPRSPRWVCDAWHVIQRHPELDWTTFTTAAERSRLTLPLAVMLRYLADDLRAPIPAGALDRLEDMARRAPAIE